MLSKLLKHTSSRMSKSQQIYFTNSHLWQFHELNEPPQGTKITRDRRNRDKNRIRFFRKSVLGAASGWFTRNTLEANSSSPDVMVHGLIPITMNLSDVKTQSPPESRLPSAVRVAVRPGDHKSRGIYDRISYTSWHRVQRGCKGGWMTKEQARRRPSCRRRRWVARRGEEREKEEGRDHSPPGFLFVRRRRDGQEKKPGRLHETAEKVTNSKTFRGPIISDETTVRHQGGCPVYLDL